MKSKKLKLKKDDKLSIRIFLLVGMVNQFHIGYISYMEWIKNLNVKYVETLYMKEEKYFNNIFTNKDILRVY